MSLVNATLRVTHQRVPTMYMLLMESCRSKLAIVDMPADCKLE